MNATLHLDPVMSFREIGDVLGITPERVKQIYNGAVRKMSRRGLQIDLGGMLSELDQRREYATRIDPANQTRGRVNWTVE